MKYRFHVIVAAAMTAGIVCCWAESVSARGFGRFHYAYRYVPPARYDLGRDRIDPGRDFGRRGIYDRDRVSVRTGLGRDSAFGVRGFHTSYWSRGYLTDRATFVRRDFRDYHCFRPDWFDRFPR